ncbi:DUF3570 domain-containing protein [Flavobacterium sp.]|uniref:DUF3570 domain-containing protein n=1 Tax=Flavobacterium sp. TaxID=239 RepID=UPI0039E3958A
MKKALFFLFASIFTVSAQQTDSTAVFKKRVLETTEVDFIASYYRQDGSHSAVNGGIGTEKLDDKAANLVIAIPLNDDDVLTLDLGLSAYTSASSSNINPFQNGNVANPSTTGASRGFWKNYSTRGQYEADDDDDDDDDYGNTAKKTPVGTPWLESTGASKKDVLTTYGMTYSHSSDDRNRIWNANVYYSSEYDYTSLGFGAGYAWLFNQKNSELNIKASAYLDKWKPIYPTELHEYSLNGDNFLNAGYFSGVTVVNQFGETNTDYRPVKFKEHTNVKRNSYAFSLGFSQILTQKLQVSVFADLLYQEGLLSTPYHRIYFADKGNYYIGQTRDIPVYETKKNTGVFRLADDVERLPDTRVKFPIGARLNYYLNDVMTLRTYYRFYSDDWGIVSHTANIEVPVKLTSLFTVFPMYRFYTQSAADYFKPIDRHYSFETYYTSDYDLSAFDSHQYGAGIGYSDAMTPIRLLRMGLKNVDLRYNHYERNDKLSANIVTVGLKFVQ